MIFQTFFPIEEVEDNFKIDYQSKIISFGSCFADNLQEKLSFFKFEAETNPFGVIFNPISVNFLIEKCLNQEEFSEEDLIFYDELWHCLSVHSCFSSEDKSLILNKLNKTIETTFSFLKNATHLIITFGTAFGYYFLKTGNLVANCHKIPQKEFLKKLQTPEEIAISTQNITKKIREINPNIKIIFTISPVRHTKDGMVQNNLSKAILNVGLNEFLSKNKDFNCYFPSYEILLDELRDYRFYQKDMIHPSEQAIDYIFERFTQSFISKEAQKTMQEVEKLQISLKHRPFNENTPKHQAFLKDLQEKIQKFQQKNPKIKF